MSKGVSLIEQQFTRLLERTWGPYPPLARSVSHSIRFATKRSNQRSRTNTASPPWWKFYQSGYVLNGQVVRYAQVKVAQPPGGGTNNSAH